MSPTAPILGGLGKKKKREKRSSPNHPKWAHEVEVAKTQTLIALDLMTLAQVTPFP